MENLEWFSEDCKFRRMIHSINIKYFSRPSSQILFLSFTTALKKCKNPKQFNYIPDKEK